MRFVAISMTRIFLAALLASASSLAQGYTNYECGATAPVRVSGQ